MTVPAELFTARTPAQAAALLDPQVTALLTAFETPATPSEAARRVNQPANRVTYHVRRLLTLGLLLEAETAGKRVRYVTAARTFRVPYRLTAAADVTDTFKPLFRDVEAQFTQAARDRAHELQEAQLEGAITLRIGQAATQASALSADPPPAALTRYALNANVKVLNLSADEYAALQGELDALLTRYAHPAAPDRRPCTSVQMLFPGTL